MTEMHTLDEEGKVTHYDVMFEHGLEKNVPVPTLNILDEAIHEHVINHDKNKEVIEHHEKDADGKTIPHVDEGFKKGKKKVKESFKNWRLTEKK